MARKGFFGLSGDLGEAGFHGHDTYSK